MTVLQQRKRRKIVLISPRFQGGAALAFAALVLIGAVLFCLFVSRDVGRALREASVFAHYRFRSAYDVAGPILARDLAGLFAAMAVAGIGLYSLMIRGVRIATERLAAIFRLSGEGDLSTPTDVQGPGEFPVLGKQADAARAQTLAVINEIRAEIDLMRKESLPEDEFRKRWDALKARIGRIAQ